MKTFLLIISFSLSITAHEKGLAHSHGTENKPNQNYLKIDVVDGPRFAMKTNFSGCLSKLCELYDQNHNAEQLIKTINHRGKDNSQDNDKAFEEAKKLGFTFKELNINRDIHKNWLNAYNKKYKTDIQDAIKFLKLKPDQDKIASVLSDKDSGLTIFRKKIFEELSSGKLVLWQNITGVTTHYMQHPEECFRLINGYNANTDELIFYDSWGETRKDKLIHVKNAFLITVKIYSIDYKK